MMARRIYPILVFVLVSLIVLSLKVLSEENRGFYKIVIAKDQALGWGDYHALIIGINKYQEWPRLRTAAEDARGLKDVLVRRYKFPEEHIILRLDAEATRNRIIQDLRNLASHLNERDNLLVYFAGHGQLDSLTGDGFWIPAEGKLKAPDTWISHSNIKNILSSDKVIAKNIVVVADSCYSGMLLRGGPSLLSMNDQGYQLKLKEMAGRRSRQVITSGGLEPVADKGREGHSLFAYYLLKGLEENTHDVIDLENLFHSYVWKPVTEIGGQRPNVGRLKTPMDEDGQFVLVAKRRDEGSGSPTAYLEKDNNFAVDADGIVFDTITKLEWFAGSDKDTTWEEAQSWAEGLEIRGDGWRMPSLKELSTLFYKGQGTRNMTPLLKTTGWWVWSGEAEGTSSACAFGFLYGDSKCKIARHLSKNSRAFAVRKKSPKDPVLASDKQYFTNTIGMKFVYIPPGNFIIGSPGDEQGRDDDERQHKVTLTKGFYMQTTEVTQGQWFAVLGTKPWLLDWGQDKGKPKSQVREDPECAVSWVTWNMGQKFIQQLNEMEGVNKYRLPTEAEWEYACRAGSSSKFWFGDDYARLGDYAWYDLKKMQDRYGRKVGSKKPNSWGLHDMLGNQLEYCEDWYGKYPAGHAVDPTGPDEGTEKVSRGGSWNSYDFNCRSANRYKIDPNAWEAWQGFRVARDY